MLSHPIVQKKKSAIADKTARVQENSYQDTAYAILIIFKTMQQRKHIRAGFSTQTCLIHTATPGSIVWEEGWILSEWFFFLTHFYCKKKAFCFSTGYKMITQETFIDKSSSKGNCTPLPLLPQNLHRKKDDCSFL